jgi:hypothetical protein
LRWRVETTFQELRTHLGVETQRQWSEAAIARTTPALLGLFSLVTIWAHQLAASTGHNILPCAAAWYPKPKPSFSDAIAAVRLALWAPPPDLSMSRPSPDGIIIPIALFRRMTNTLCHPT